MWIINRRRSRALPADPKEYSLDLQGFPRRIFLRNGRRPRLLYATATQIADHIKLLEQRQEEDPEIRKWQEFHRRLREYKPGTTVAEMLEIEGREQ